VETPLKSQVFILKPTKIVNNQKLRTDTGKEWRKSLYYTYQHYSRFCPAPRVYHLHLATLVLPRCTFFRLTVMPSPLCYCEPYKHYTRFCPLLRTYPPCTSTRSSYLMCACSCAWRKPSPQCCPPRTHDAPTCPVCHTSCTCTWTRSSDFTGTYYRT